MKTSRPNVLLPAISSAGSFFGLVLLMMLTSPVKNISFAVVFFIILLVFLISFGYLVTTLQAGSVSRKSRGRILIITIFIMILLMFRSAGSLSWVDGLVLILVASGLVFYGSHRP